MSQIYSSPGCGVSTVLNRRSSRWQVSLAPVSGDGALAGLPVTPPPPHAFTSDGSAAWRTKSSSEKQCRAVGVWVGVIFKVLMCYSAKSYNLVPKYTSRFRIATICNCFYFYFLLDFKQRLQRSLGNLVLSYSRYVKTIKTIVSSLAGLHSFSF